MHIKKGDTVVVLSGKYEDKKTADGKVKTAKVLEVSPEEGKVIVENVHKVSKHLKARKQGEQSTILKVDAPIYACKVQLYCPDCKKGVRTHVEVVDGKKIRVCSGKRDGKPCGYKFD
ncbi:MAG: 50S ribosomal protein L24 [Clostridia bacterium]|nr:50S ribosomal protein L24 [Clostridia bacterium]